MRSARVNEVVSRIPHIRADRTRIELEPGRRVTWRDFEPDDEAIGQRAMDECLRNGSLRIRDLSREAVERVGKKGKWEALEELGEGGQGQVFKALDTELVNLNRAGAGLWDALPKIHHPERPGDLAGGLEGLRESLTILRRFDATGSYGALKVLHVSVDPDRHEKARARMKRELDTYRLVSHPSLLRLLDSRIEDGWLVTEYRADGTLDQAIDRYQGDVVGALSAFLPLVDAVVALHAKDVVHRDIKPANLFLDPRGRLILGDAGIAFFRMEDGKTRLTETLENVGSRDWMPLWAEGQRWEDVEPSFDLFSLGKLLWAMLAGRPKITDKWYGYNDDLRLEALLPANELARRVARLIDSVVVAKSKDQKITSAVSLREEAASLLERARRYPGGDRCVACLDGEYRDSGNQFDTLGIRMRTCPACGHIQLFSRA